MPCVKPVSISSLCPQAMGVDDGEHLVGFCIIPERATNPGAETDDSTAILFATAKVLWAPFHNTFASKLSQSWHKHAWPRLAPVLHGSHTLPVRSEPVGAIMTITYVTTAGGRAWASV